MALTPIRIRIHKLVCTYVRILNDELVYYLKATVIKSKNNFLPKFNSGLVFGTYFIVPTVLVYRISPIFFSRICPSNHFDANPDPDLHLHHMEIWIRIGIKTMPIHITGTYRTFYHVPYLTN